MILCNSTYKEFANIIKKYENRIIVYGAGMIGRIVVPYVIESHGLAKYVDCYIDADLRKKDTTIAIGDSEFVVRTPDYLESINENAVISKPPTKYGRKSLNLLIPLANIAMNSDLPAILEVKNITDINTNNAQKRFAKLGMKLR